MTNINFDKYFGIANSVILSELIGKLIEPMFTLKDFQNKGINSYTLFHWNKEGLVWKYFADSSDERSWNRFSFLEFLWIKIVILLRSYGISFKIIRSLKDALSTSMSLNEIISDLHDLESFIEFIPEENKEDFLNWLNSADNNSREPLYTIEIPIFLLLVASEIVNRENILLCINSKGEFLPFILSRYNELKSMDDSEQFLNNSFISVSLSELLKDFINGKGRLEISGKLELLTHREAQIIQIIRTSKDLKSINIRFDANNEVNLIEEARIKKVNPETRILEMIMKNGYHNIEITTEKGNIVKCLNTRKIKLEGDE